MDGAQSSGARLVSFNKQAFESFGAEQGTNAPVSEYAAFAYGTALNALLHRGGGRRLRIADATVVFWAEGGRGEADETEEAFFAAVDPKETTAEAEAKLRARLVALAEGRGVEGTALSPETRVFILGLAPNAARLSVRLWQSERFGELARHVLRFWEDLAIEPRAWNGPPAAWSLLYEVALQRKAENIPPLLGGALMQAVLTGGPLPRTLLAAVVARVRADGEVTPRRAAICKAVLNRNSGKEMIPVSLDRDNPDPAYRLGRLFAELEKAQRGALGRGVNATIKDRYFAAGSATPARIFPLLIRNAVNHLAKMRKSISERGWAIAIEREIATIWEDLDAELPRSLSLEAQGRFIAGYYHQSSYRAPKPELIEEEGAEG